MKAALPLGEARCKSAERHGARRKVCDEWYIDDGQLICAPEIFDPWLRIFDEELARIGATRGSGDSVKSVARLVCPDDRAADFDGWASEYVRRTCRVQEPNSPAKALGAVIGCDSEIQSSAAAACAKVSTKRAAIASLDDAAAELVLTRRCADVGNVNYWLRCYGDKLRGEFACKFDVDLRVALEECLGGPLPDTAWCQASVGVAQGGLGLRRAEQVALPSFIASRVASRPMVSDMFTHVEDAELGAAACLLRLYDQRTDEAVAELLRALPASCADDVADAVAAGHVAAAERWARLTNVALSREDSEMSASQDVAADSLRQIGSVAPGLVMDAGAEDDEHPDYRGAPRGPALQRRLCELVDASVLAELREHFVSAGCSFGTERLADLGHAGTAHTWLWALSPVHGPVIEEESEFVEAVRVRLGAGGPPDCGPCGCCGSAQLDAAGGHASCCAPGESTRGHNAVRDVVFDFSVAADDATEKEPEDLVPSRPRLRPADILSPAAVPGRLAALDVGVASPFAQAAGLDAAASMFARKVAERESIAPELAAQNIVYQPIVWTTFGRPHEGATAAMASIAKKLARRRGRASRRALLRQMRAAVSVCLARRAARMSLACWPRLAEGAGQYVRGRCWRPLRLRAWRLRSGMNWESL